MAQPAPLERTPEEWLAILPLERNAGAISWLARRLLRYFTAEGALLPRLEDDAQTEKQRADKFAARLRELGLDPDQL